MKDYNQQQQRNRQQDHQISSNKFLSLTDTNESNRMQSRTTARREGCLILVATVFCIVSALSLSANAFNLENRLPLTKYGASGSYFGYSVAEHEETEGIKW